jgi:hypothetical protein
VDNEIVMFGPDVTFTISPTLELKAQYLRRMDERPFFADVGPTDTDVDMGFAELSGDRRATPAAGSSPPSTTTSRPRPRCSPSARARLGPLDSYRAAALGGNYMMARNLRLTSELQYDFDREDVRFVAGFMSAF